MNAGQSPLRTVLAEAAAAGGVPLKDLTVLAPRNDPFRLDTAGRHRDGQWLAQVLSDFGMSSQVVHLRGIHYAITTSPRPYIKPDGTRYENNDDDWTWLSEDAAKAARWLGYIPFEQIIDKRNAKPVVRIRRRDSIQAYLTTELNVSIPEAWELEPQIDVEGFDGVQPYRLALIGEKSSLEQVLAPVADRYQADLYLPTGEISDTQIYQMAVAAQDDSRPLVVFYFADCDPAGWQMGISVARKLQACRELLPKMPHFEMHRVALTPVQVLEHGMPFSPLKATEKRAGRWREAMGVEQTEVDAWLTPAAIGSGILRRIADEAIAPFYDRTLDQRVFEARGRWLEQAQQVVDNVADSGHLQAMRERAVAELEDMRRQLIELNAALRIDPGDIDLPPFDVPQAELGLTGQPEPLIDSCWPFAEQCRRLKASKEYADVSR